VRRKHAQRGEREARSKTIADLTRAIEELVSRSKKPQELEGIMTEAKVLVQQWKIKEPSGRRRPLFDDTVNPTAFLLAALVVVLRRDHELIERIHRHFPDELIQLDDASRLADYSALAANLRLEKWRKLSTDQQYERRRNEVHRPGLGLIGEQFGFGISLWPLRSVEPTCLDEIFSGGHVNMLGLVELFGIERHRLLELASGTGEKGRFSWRSIVKIMDDSLVEKPRQKRKLARAGRPPRMPWLNDPDLRVRVLSGIERRINTLSVPQHIKSAFETVVRRRLSRVG
jgi:hypothetical protein